MKLIAGLVIGVNLMYAIASGIWIGRRAVGSPPASVFYISLPQGALLCSVGRIPHNGWQTMICSDAGGFPHRSTRPPTEPSLPPTMPGKPSSAIEL